MDKYLDQRPKLKYRDKVNLVVDDICKIGTVLRSDLKERHALTNDGVASILANVTMAIQENGEVWSPELGGWYAKTGEGEELTYTVCPGFRDAWKSCK